jgi:AraC-like DNA-binding protein
MPLAADKTTVDRILFHTPSVTVGAFRCSPTHPLFSDSGPIEQHCFVFPRTAVVIEPDGARPFVADPTIVTLYNKDQGYRRKRVSPDGDRCDWFGVEDGVLRDALAVHDRGAAERDRPIQFSHASTDATTYLKQRSVFTRISQGNVDALFAEEAVVALLDMVLSAAYSQQRVEPRQPRRGEAPSHVFAAQQMIGRRFAEPLTLTRMAQAVGCSAYYLCRTFHRLTGRTLHAYRDQMRLRNALERLSAGEKDLTRLALDLGYSSHSHFTASFRSAFHVPPSAARADVCARHSSGCTPLEMMKTRPE